MTKVLYVSHYRDRTGYGQAATDYILSLDSAGVDVVVRPVIFQGNKEPPRRIIELEQKDTKGITHVIQHTLPHLMSYCGYGGIKNIGVFAWETTHFRNSTWPSKLNAMDEVWVINYQQKEACLESGVERPIHIVPHACDIVRYQRDYERLALPFQEDDFVFYTIGEFTRRKNFAAFLKAFHLEFSPQEPVQCLIKTSGVDQQTFSQFIDSIKFGLKLYPDIKRYKAETVILDERSDEEICRLHKSCDVFVASSFGEAWGIPAFDAMAFGKTPIFTQWGGYREYLDETCGYPCSASMEPVFGMNDGFRDIYTGNEEWASVSIHDIRRAMRKAYERHTYCGVRARRGMDRAWKFSHHNVGKMMQSILEEN